MKTQEISAVLDQIRARKPLVHNITNFVAMNLNANALLALGASPVMAHAHDEVEEMAGLSQSVVLNMGTLSPDWVESMVLAAKSAQKKNIPVAFDPVGAGATACRNRAASRILSEARPTVIRGNASEIRSLSGYGGQTRGVDSTARPEDVLPAARALSQSTDAVICVSGAIDHVVTKNRCVKVSNGYPGMTRVTGMGCTATALIGAALAVQGDPFLATVAAMTFMGIAGEKATEKSTGPGTFGAAFLDALFQLAPSDILKHARWEED